MSKRAFSGLYRILSGFIALCLLSADVIGAAALVDLSPPSLDGLENGLTSSQAQADDQTPYTYDANGNMISDGTQCFTYNEANQLAAVRTCATDQLVAEYIYDHTGQRIVEKHYQDGSLRETVYTIGKHTETAFAADGGRQDTTYYRANNDIVARENPDNSRTFYHQDHLGSTGALTDASGQLVEETRYYPFGAVRTGGTLSRFLYTGQESDAETGLYYYGARFYDPALARFVQPDSLLPDPYTPQLLNRYSYVVNNPLVYTDPSGNWPSLNDFKGAWSSIGTRLGNGARTVKSYAKLFFACESCGEYTPEDSRRVNPAVEKAVNHFWQWTIDFEEQHSEQIAFTADFIDSVPGFSQHADNLRYFFGQISTEEHTASTLVNIWTGPMDALTAGRFHSPLEALSNAAATDLLYKTGNITQAEANNRYRAEATDFGIGLATGWSVGKLGFKTHYARANPFGKAWFLGPSENYRRGAWFAENVVGGWAVNQIKDQFR